jgi:hypothetical protein
VPDVDNPTFWRHMDAMVKVNTELTNLDQTTPALLRPLKKAVLYERLGSLLLRVVCAAGLPTGSWDFRMPSQLQY